MLHGYVERTDCPSLLGSTATLPLKFLTFKLVMLLALTRPSRSADLAPLQLDRRQFRPEGVVFLLAALAKQSGLLRSIFFPCSLIIQSSVQWKLSNAMR